MVSLFFFFLPFWQPANTSPTFEWGWVKEYFQEGEIQMKEFYISTLREQLGPDYKNKLYLDEKTVSHDELRHLSVRYLGFDGAAHQGQLIVHEDVATEALEIFQELYELGFPIEKINLVSDYGYSDDLSMADNNSSGFNFRYIEGTGELSWHAFGRAIDINPLQNPYILKTGQVLPAGGAVYTDRSLQAQGMIEEDSPVVKIFKDRGWDWGGDWDHPKDYHHFEKPSQ